MKLLFVIDHLGPAGSQHQMVALACALAGRGHKVEFFIYYPRIDHFEGKLRDAGIPVHSVRKSGRFDLRPLASLRRRVHAGRFDVALSFLTTPNVYNVLACLGTSTPAVVSERSAFTQRRIPFSMRMRFSTYRLADHIVVNSRHQHERFGAEFPWMSERSRTILNGVDLGRFSPSEDRLERDVLDPPELLAVGSIHRGKNFLGLIEGIRRYRSRFGPTPVVRWAGREPSKDEDRAAFDEAKRVLEREGLSSHWEWLGVRQDVPDLLRQHDGFIHPSLFEGLPNAVCEALAAGRPVLASDVCDHPWLLGEGDRGLLFDPLDADAICAAIRRFTTMDAEDRTLMAQKARQFASAQLGMDACADAYESLFEALREST